MRDGVVWPAKGGFGKATMAEVMLLDSTMPALPDDCLSVLSVRLRFNTGRQAADGALIQGAVYAQFIAGDVFCGFGREAQSQGDSDPHCNE